MKNRDSALLDDAYQLATQGNYADALALCDRFDAEHPGDSRGLRERAAILLHKREYAAAEEALQRLLDTGSQEPCDHFDHGRVLAMQGRHREAIAALTRCIDISAKHGDDYYVSSARLVRAFAQSESGHAHEAARDLDELPEDTKLWIGAHGLVTKASLVAKLASVGRARE
jgi:tetratricopeptide (TPR) repeat protein